MICNHHRLTGLALALVVAALLAPAASARPIDQVSPQSQSGSVTRHVKPPPSQVRVAPATSDQGVDWGDVGLGAGAGFALAMIAVGGALAISSHRRRHMADARPAARA
jgi:hypothetical protein